MFLVSTDKEVYVRRATMNYGEKTFINYSTYISAKDYNNKSIKCFLNLKFPKDIDIPDKSKIKILDGYIAFNPYYKNGHKYPYIYVRNYELIEVGKDPDDDGSAFDDYDDANYSFV